MSQSNALGTCRRFSHTPPRHSKTTDSLGGIKPNADSLCYLRFTEKARPPGDDFPVSRGLRIARKRKALQLFSAVQRVVCHGSHGAERGKRKPCAFGRKAAHSRASELGGLLDAFSDILGTTSPFFRHAFEYNF